MNGKDQLEVIFKLIDEQAEDEALWTKLPIEGAYVQQELRILHMHIERLRDTINNP